MVGYHFPKLIFLKIDNRNQLARRIKKHLY